MARRPRVTFIGRSGADDPYDSRPPVAPDERETLAAWMRETVEAIEAETAERIEKLRNVGEHPSPVFARMVREHARLRLPHSHIAALMCIPVQTIEKHYAAEIIAGEAEAMVNVTRNMLRIATSTNDPSAAKVGLAWLERAGGDTWKPAAKRVEVNDTTAPPVIDSSLLTDEERAQLKAICERVVNRPNAVTDDATRAGLGAAEILDDLAGDDGSDSDSSDSDSYADS